LAAGSDRCIAAAPPVRLAASAIRTSRRRSIRSKCRDMGTRARTGASKARTDAREPTGRRLPFACAEGPVPVMRIVSRGAFRASLGFSGQRFVVMELEQLQQWIGRAERNVDRIDAARVVQLAATLDRDDVQGRAG